MDLDFGSDMPEDDADRADPPEEVDAANGNDDESMADSNEGGDEESQGASRSMRSSRSPEPVENDDEEENDGQQQRTGGTREPEKSILQPGASDCAYYDMTPTMAAPQATHINCVVTTKNLRWIFTGGQDGYIRKHDFHQTITGKFPLTVAQKHPFVDTVQKSGVLLSYWENDDADGDAAAAAAPAGEKTLSPIYCLAVERDAMWMLSGQYSGNIKLQSVRVEEGKTVATLRAHTSPVSVLQLLHDEKSLLSGGWDKQIYDWDLETGKTRRNFVAGNKITGQVSTIALRPENAPAMDLSLTRPQTSESDRSLKIDLGLPKPTSPASSNSFDPLFDEEEEEEGNENPTVPTATTTTAAAAAASNAPDADSSASFPDGTGIDPSSTAADGREDIFLSACIDGTMSIWDRRKSDAVARIPLPPGVPPWCMSACWSLNGESFYCGRRNQTVEEYSMRSNVTQAIRTLKLPNNSGPVTSVTAMPNGRSLICASADNVRMYDLKASSSGMPFLIIPGHHGGAISQFWTDRSCRYAFSTSGNRGWDGVSTEVMIGYEIKPVMR